MRPGPARADTGTEPRDLNENGLVDGLDAHVDVLVGFDSERVFRGGLVDVRG